MLAYGRASSRDVTSLQNWLDQTGCLTREESAYLDKPNDLISLASSSDSALKRLENWIEDQLIQYHKGFRAVRMFLKLVGQVANSRQEPRVRDLDQLERLHILQPIHQEYC
jgi:hypothetical protein